MGFSRIVDAIKKRPRLIQSACAIAAIALLTLISIRTEPAALTLSMSVAATKTVVIDAGHGGFDHGASGANGTYEEVLNLAVAKRLQKLFEQAGMRVIMTRENDEAIADTKKGDMAKRREIIEQDGIDAVVSIHMNAYRDKTIHGHVVFYQQGAEPGRELAQCVQDKLDAAMDKKPGLAHPGDYLVLRSGKCPCVLVECAFISNPDDEKKMLTESHQQLLAEAICQGVIAYFDKIG